MIIRPSSLLCAAYGVALGHYGYSIGSSQFWILLGLTIAIGISMKLEGVLL